MLLNFCKVQDKCMEQYTPLSVFINFTKAFDTVSREALGTVIKKLGCRDKVINLIKSFYIEMKAQTSYGNDNFESFDVKNVVKHGCVLVHFALYLTALTDSRGSF